MMTIARLVASDLSDSLRRDWWKLAIVVIAFVLICAALAAQSSAPGDRTWGDYLAALFAGMPDQAPEAGHEFRLPTTWMLVMLAIIFTTMAHPYENMIGMGKQVMLLSENRSVWWVAKCFWVAALVALFFILAVGVSLLFAVCSGGDVSLAVTEGLSSLLGLREGWFKPGANVGEFLALAPLSLFAICLVQMLLSLVIRPMLSFVVTVAYLFLSTYFVASWLLGNYLMAARVSNMVGGLVDPVVGAVVSVMAALCTMMLGAIVVSRIDILEKEGI